MTQPSIWRLSLGHEPDAALDILSSLVNKSLVAVRPAGSAPRYRLLESVRTYALERLVSTGAEPRAREAHVAVVVKMAVAAEPAILAGHIREQAERLMQEHANITAALDYALDAKGDHASALRIVGGLMLYLKVRSSFVESTLWCERVLAGTESLETRERGRALLCHGVGTLHFGKAAGSLLLEAARVAALNGDRWAEGYANGFYALWLCSCGNPALAEEPAGLVELIGKELDDPILRGLAGLARGWIHISVEDYTAAIAVLGAVRHLGPDSHQRHFIAMYMGLSRFALGEYSKAAADLLDALDLALGLYNARGMAGPIEACGYICTKMGLCEDAVRFLALAHKVRERTAVPLFRFWVEHHNAIEASLRARLDAAEFDALWEAGRRMREEDAVNEVSARLRQFCAEGQTPIRA